MKRHCLLLVLLATSAPCTSTSIGTDIAIQGQEEAPSSTNIIPTTTTTTVETNSPLPTTTLPAQHLEEAPQIPASAAAAAPITKQFQARQHTVATRTTSGVIITSTTIPPTPTPAPVATGSDGDDDDDDDDDEPGDTDSEEAPTSTVTITITSNRTTTIRPTVTVTSLFSSMDSTTSGASGRLEPWVSVDGPLGLPPFVVAMVRSD
ncbi:hypothetical protein FHL15_010690 [Xylaria flabelliformis]|uniref:Uncharacterized protein n=1 Tax=Xylaria flabelliformis TaxID=2512241 RepID=A0A553HKF8_9PEZI|nr:hypothetical protein FHL15_010690 [Xylaria flabelliformis]